jgi:hypothetical protein
MLYYSSIHTCVCVCVAVLFFHISRSRVESTLLFLLFSFHRLLVSYYIFTIRFLRLCRYCCWWIPRSSICCREIYDDNDGHVVGLIDVWDFLSRLVARRQNEEELCTTTRHARVSTGESHNFYGNNFFFFSFVLFFCFPRKGKKKKRKRYVNITFTPIWKHCLQAMKTGQRYKTRSFKGSDFFTPEIFIYLLFSWKAPATIFPV